MNKAYLRRILVDHASEKRGGSVSVTSFDDQQIAATSDLDILALDEALDRLAAMDAQQSQIVELRFSGGLTIEETAEALGISPATVKREWRRKVWLCHQLART